MVELAASVSTDKLVMSVSLHSGCSGGPVTSIFSGATVLELGLGLGLGVTSVESGHSGGATAVDDDVSAAEL